MGKKINVFRENDVEHLKTYLGDVVREVVFGEAEEGEQAPATSPEEAVKKFAAELNKAVNKYYAGEKATQGQKPYTTPPENFKVEKRGADDKEREVWRITIKVPGQKELDNPLSGTGDPRQEIFGAVEDFVQASPYLNSLRVQRMKGGKDSKEAVAWNRTGARASGGFLKKGMIYLDSAVVQGGAVVEVVIQGKRAEDPNRGELSEAWMALAVAKRFMNLPQVKVIPKTGKVPGMVSPQEIIDWADSTALTVTKDGLGFAGKVTNAKGKTDTIRMKIELRGFSLSGLYDAKTGKVGEFARTDKLSLKYLQGATEYANREVIRWALGQFEGGTEEQKLGWFVNDFENNITIAAVGTAAQSQTKVDLEMTCTGNCPFNTIQGGVGADPQLARLSLKAGNIAHFGGGAATSPEKSVRVMESVFPVGTPPAVSQWMKSAGQIFQGKDPAKRKAVLNQLVNLYTDEVEAKLASDADSADFIAKMVKGLLKHSVKGKEGSDFEDESGVILVQTTDKGDFFKLDFNKLEEAFATGKWGAASTKGGETPYLAVYKREEGGTPPTAKNDARILFTMRALARKGAEILRLEKGPLMKKLLHVDQEERLVFRNGEMVTVDADGNPLPESLEEKILAILKEGLKIS